MTPVVPAHSTAGTTRAGGSRRRGASRNHGLVEMAITTTTQKNPSAVAVCAVASASGIRNSTVIPPSTACVITSANAALRAIAPIARGSRITAHSIRVSVTIETALAATR